MLNSGYIMYLGGQSKHNEYMVDKNVKYSGKVLHEYIHSMYSRLWWICEYHGG